MPDGHGHPGWRPGPPADRPRVLSTREAWMAARLARERQVWRDPERRLRRSALHLAIGAFGLAARACGLWRRGQRNAAAVQLNRFDLYFDTLPPAFDGYTILHLGDLHADEYRPPLEAATRMLGSVTADLCVLTGDYSRGYGAPADRALAAIAPLLAAIDVPDGIWAVPGNHDSATILGPLEDLGVRFLVNDYVTLHRQGEAIHVLGTDDVHYFETPAFGLALATVPPGFRIVLVHSAERADQAAAAGFALQLSGHSHGGQICLPGGQPVLTVMRRFRRYARGLWQHDTMTGYTTTGLGTSGLPLRFHCPPEIALIQVRCPGPVSGLT